MRESTKRSRKIAYYGMFAALALIMSYVERFIPVPVPVPGVKPGLANIVILLVLYTMDEKSAFYISVVRVIVASLLFSGMAGFFYSIAGAMLSLGVMILLKRADKMSIVGVSVAGGISHNVGQILVACAVLENIRLMYYLPILLISGIITGFFTGIVAKAAMRYVRGIH
ncbi:MAG: Gx transporter family protein [Firmicutes bacterium]|nr:Gx transporter family protein [Bacillota bacterium]MBR0105246.1 Gx transporter family protein [Bacillota bacterium]